jgi:UV excision repair protein RAD23
VKQKISETDPKAAVVEKQKLIHSGRILVNEKSVEESGIKEGDFLVLMVSSTISATKPKVESAPIKEKANTNDAVTNTANTANTGSTSTSNANTASTATTPTANTSTTTTSVSVNEEAVNSISEMGFPRDEVIRALRASFNNADRAVEYLTNGIPEGIVEEEGDASNEPNGGGDLSEVNGHATSVADNPLAFLLQSPQFIQLRLVVQQNPRLLGPLLEQIAQSNPEVFELIKDNQEDFMSLIQTPLTETELSQLAAETGDEGEDGAGDDYEDTEEGTDPTAVIQVSEEEQAAIERLMALGFDRPRVVEAYFACDKNETIAANFLFEHMNDADF